MNKWCTTRFKLNNALHLPIYQKGGYKIENQDIYFSFSLELKAEIERLKLSEGNQEISARALAEVSLLREKLKETQRMLAESTR